MATKQAAPKRATKTATDLTPAEREALFRVYRKWQNTPLKNDEADECLDLVTAALRAVPRLAGEERDRLAGFASWVLEQHTGTIDGCDIEAKAVELGLMDAVMCDGTCAECEGAVPGEDICYRPHLLLNNEGSAE